MKSSRISKSLAKKSLARLIKKVSNARKVYVIINGTVECCS